MCNKKHSVEIGQRFKIKDFNTLTVEETLTAGKIIVSCDKCSQDTELFPELFNTTIYNIKNDKMPCACSKSYKWSKEQYEIRVKRFAESIGYTFLGFNGEYKTYNTKIKLICDKGHYHDTNTINHFLGATERRCSFCKKENLANLKLYTEGEAKVELFLNMAPEHKFIGWNEPFKGIRTSYKYYCEIAKSIFISKANTEKYEQNRRCCSTCGGFDVKKSSYLYVFEFKSKKKHFLKYGITNKEPILRMKQILNSVKKDAKEVFVGKVIHSFKFVKNNGKECLNLETEIKRIFSEQNKLCDSNKFFNYGFSEMVPHSLENLSLLLNIIKTKTGISPNNNQSNSFKNRAFYYDPSYLNTQYKKGKRNIVSLA